MAEFDIDVTELEAMVTRLRGISGAGALAFEGIARKYGSFTKQEAIRLAPYDMNRTAPGPHLRATIQNKRNVASRQFTSSEWEVTAPHAAPQEYGFKHYKSKKWVPAANGGQGYVRPALKRYRKEYIEELASEAKAQFGTLKKASRPQLGSVPSLVNTRRHPNA